MAFALGFDDRRPGFLKLVVLQTAVIDGFQEVPHHEGVQAVLLRFFGRGDGLGRADERLVEGDFQQLEIVLIDVVVMDEFQGLLEGSHRIEKGDRGERHADAAGDALYGIPIH